MRDLVPVSYTHLMPLVLLRRIERVAVVAQRTVVPGADQSYGALRFAGVVLMAGQRVFVGES